MKLSEYLDTPLIVVPDLLNEGELGAKVNPKEYSRLAYMLLDRKGISETLTIRDIYDCPVPPTDVIQGDEGELKKRLNTNLGAMYSNMLTDPNKFRNLKNDFLFIDALRIVFFPFEIRSRNQITQSELASVLEGGEDRDIAQHARENLTSNPATDNGDFLVTLYP